MKALRATKDVFTKQLEEQVTIIRSALEKNLAGAQTTLKELRRRLDELNQRQLTSKNTSAAYNRAKNG